MEVSDREGLGSHAVQMSTPAEKEEPAAAEGEQQLCTLRVAADQVGCVGVEWRLVGCAGWSEWSGG